MTIPPAKRRIVLFVMQSPAYVRNFEPVLRALAARGDRTTVLFEGRKAGGDSAGLGLIDRLCAELDGLDYELAGPLPRGLRGQVRICLQAGQDYLRYFDPPYGDGANRLRARSVAFLPARVERALASMLRRWPRARRALSSLARRINDRLGEDRRVRERARAPPPGGADRHADGPVPLPAGRLGTRRAGVGYRHDALRPQLGQPHQQGTHARPARSSRGLERGAAPRGDRASRCDACLDLDRGGVAVRSLVRMADVAFEGRALRSARPAGGASDRPLRLLVAVHRRARAAGRGELGPGAAVLRGPSASPRRA